MQWMSERNSKSSIFGDNNFKTKNDFIEFIERVECACPEEILILANKVLMQDGLLSIELLKEYIAHSKIASFSGDMLNTVICAKILAVGRGLSTWLDISRIAYNSWQIEHWLSEAMSAYASIDSSSRDFYADLVVEIFEALDRRELNSESERSEHARAKDWAGWSQANYKLEEIWYGLRNSDFISYDNEMRFFGLLNQIDPEIFQILIAGSKNPFLVNAALLGSGVGAFSPRFAMWEVCVDNAPPAFNSDGTWTESVLLPLLLVHAFDHLLEPGRRAPRYGADEDEIIFLTTKVVEMIEAVVGVIARRKDALAIFSRWGTWLMRQVIINADEEFSDVRSRDFVNNNLLEVIGKYIQREGWSIISSVPEGVASWETWCYYCMRSFLAHGGFICMPSFVEFSSQWKIMPENWYGLEGRTLLERSNLHLLTNDIPGLSANFLALSLASSDNFASEWQQIWSSASYLREVLEFGCIDAGTKTYSDRVDASRLLLLLGCIGLACFDQVVSRIDTTSDLLIKEIVTLHRSLALSIIDVLHFDDTLNRDKWQALLMRLAVRRAYWDVDYIDEHRVVLFAGQQEPTIQDYISYLQVDTGNLIDFLHTCMLNRLSASKLREDLRSAAVDLRACVDTLKQLHELRDHRYPIDKSAVKAIEPLMNCRELQ